MSYNKSNPFDWDNEPLTVEKADSKETVFNTIPTQRNASYADSAEEEFINNGFDSFVENIEAPTPQIRRICGIECPKKE